MPRHSSVADYYGHPSGGLLFSGVNIKKETVKDFVVREMGKKAWDAFVQSDPANSMYAAVPWQDPSNFATTVSYIDATLYPAIEALSTKDDGKGSMVNWRQIQQKCWETYRTFGPLHSAINMKADLICGSGFHVGSGVWEMEAFIRDLFYSYRNRLYMQIPGWLIRMQAEGELFILIAFDETGNAYVRVLEPDRIGSGDDFGLTLSPSDATQTLFYLYKSTTGDMLIPDARFIIDPLGSAEQMKLLPVKPDPALLKGSQGGGKFRAIGGFNRFILHWKNLTGILEYKRDTSSLITILEAIKLYWNALKWELDHKKALTAYTIEVSFEDSPAGKIAWQIWNKMTAEQRDATGLTKPLTPGSRVFTMPGVSIDIKAPNLPKMSGDNVDLLNIAGAGARTPQDMWQGQSAGATNASLKASRSPYEADIENHQNKLFNFLKYEFLRACIAGKVALGNTTLYAGKNIKLPNAYKMPWVKDVKTKNITTVDAELIEAVDITFPVIHFEQDLSGLSNMVMGSKHTGATGLGVSAESALKRLGFGGLAKEKRDQIIEEDIYGKPPSGQEAPGATPATPATPDGAPPPPPAQTPDTPPAKKPAGKPATPKQGQ